MSMGSTAILGGSAISSRGQTSFFAMAVVKCFAFDKGCKWPKQRHFIDAEKDKTQNHDSVVLVQDDRMGFHIALWDTRSGHQYYCSVGPSNVRFLMSSLPYMLT